MARVVTLTPLVVNQGSASVGPAYDTANSAFGFSNITFELANSTAVLANSAAVAANTASIVTLNFHVDGYGSVITPGKKMSLPSIPFNGVISSYAIVSEVSCNANIELWKSNYPRTPVVANSMVGTDFITLVYSDNRQNNILTNWNTNLAANDIITLNINSIDTTKFFDLSLTIIKTTTFIASGNTGNGNSGGGDIINEFVGLNFSDFHNSPYKVTVV